MANNKSKINRSAVNLLPTFFRTEKNSKFLSSTIDQLTSAPELERIDGYAGSKFSNTYNPSTDVYLPETTELRSKYQLEPALIIKELDGSIKKAFGIDDLINQISYHGGDVTNLNRLFKPKINSYNPHIDWDKFVNFREYFWLFNGPSTITITASSLLDIEEMILGKSSYTSSTGLEFINGLKIRFLGNIAPANYIDIVYIVEGVGSNITLIEYTTLSTYSNLSSTYTSSFDSDAFDTLPFDSSKKLPITPEYVTINRASKDLNPWSCYNRWFHKDVIVASALANGIEAVFTAEYRAKRPIVEFNSNLQLWNFGTTSIVPVDIIDTTTVDAFSTIENSSGYYVDNVLLENGFRIIFQADTDPLIINKVYEVRIITVNFVSKINLVEVEIVKKYDAVSIKLGDTNFGTNWQFNGTSWARAQQRITRNQFPLFDLFDKTGISYSNTEYYNSDFAGNALFGYSVGSGPTDSVLGFPLDYTNVGVEGTYLFKNYFNDGIITNAIVGSTVYETVPTYETYLRFNNDTIAFKNIWSTDEYYDIPVIQSQIVSSIIDSVEITVFDNPGLITDLTIGVFFNNVKQPSTDYAIEIDRNKLIINFTTPIDGSIKPIKLLFKCVTLTSPNETGIYETPINLTNNPLNGPILKFTLSELSDHVKSMVDRDPAFVGTFPGVSNLKSLPNISVYGTRLISNQNPLVFAQYFITNPEHSVINAIKKSSIDYYQFKINLINTIINADNQLTSAQILDAALAEIILGKNSAFPYAQSDMLGYGDNNIKSVHVVSDPRNTIYPITSAFDITVASNRAIFVYVNDILLMRDKDYTFDQYDANISIVSPLAKNDIITIKDFASTIGTYIPPTPTKLGLFPKYEPSIYIDNSYATAPTKVIQGHDGSITVAFSKPEEANNYIDLALLEYEIRIFNNLKAEYNPDLINIDSIMPGLFRDSEYSYSEIYDLIQGEFLKWTSMYGVDFTTNSTYDINNHKTYNFKSATDYLFNSILPGSWRSIYKFYFDTDRPNTHPWEMLGFIVKPTWWETEYGVAPYTAGNLILWNDLEAGRILQGPRAGIDIVYARPNLNNIIPVDDSGNLIDIRNWASINANETIDNTDQSWAFGDMGPVETSWKRSSLWPFAVQLILALTKPALYASMMFDPARLQKDITGQYNYGVDEIFLKPSAMSLFTDVDASGNTVLSSGYSVWVIENGKQRSSTYLTDLKQDLQLGNLNLFHKASGFLSKDKLNIVIDSVSPATINPGVVLPNEDYTLHFNVSNPVESIPISGIIIEKLDGQFIIKGYDKQFPFFKVFYPEHKSVGPAITIGGKSETFLTWTTNAFYQANSIVSYNSNFYRVISTHNSGSSFTVSNYSVLASLPIVGGVSVLSAVQFSTTTTTVRYGSKFNTIQEIYDIIMGYGHYLESRGFVFDEYSQELSEILNWQLSGKEFLYWTTQNWANGTIITLSPFATALKYKFTNSVVDNVLNSFYEYSLLKANGQPFSDTNFSLTRTGSICSITAKNTTDGLYFARLNLVQKEHAIILNNVSLFNDIIYDIESGYRQSRIKLTGFKTANWDGDFSSPGFIYDDAQIANWTPYIDYKAATIVKYAGKYYSANLSIVGAATFTASEWNILGSIPVAQLLPNFDYKINQFEDFYSLDIDNFDIAQQKMAQHLIGYTPRSYLDNIFVNPIAQYKFYQGFIREKGTRNSIDKLAKASVHNLQGRIEFSEEWAFRVGNYGNYTSYNELEFPMREVDFGESSQIIKFVDDTPNLPNDPTSYIMPADMSIVPDDYQVASTFLTSTGTSALILPTAGYVRIDDVTATAYNKQSILDIANNSALANGNTIWIGFTDNGNWDVYRYTSSTASVVNSITDVINSAIIFVTDIPHNLTAGELVSINGLSNDSDGVYAVVDPLISSTEFSVYSTVTTLNSSTTTASLFKFESVRVTSIAERNSLATIIPFATGDLVWIDNIDNKWNVHQKSNAGWNVLRIQDDLVDLLKINKLFTMDSVSEQVIDYLDMIDPLKGHISGIADQEIRYKTAFDPAIYSIGVPGVVVDTETSWIDNNVGQLWWDLSTVKYVWYEQGDLEYRKNSWGNLFPGASIDIYEWVKSEYLPSQWSALADTNDGIAKGISGQPKYADNSVISVQQYYNATTSQSTNIYYFWVKNTVILPVHKERKLPASEVARLVFSPKNYGIKYISIISNDAVSVTNVKDTLRENEIYLNIAKELVNTKNNKHTEWLLIEENSTTSMPNALLEKKLLDSLLGKDSIGNIVPDPLLSKRTSYGISIRPRQSMFKDRVAALRNAIDYVNYVLLTTEYIITNFVDFTNLNSSETVPDISSNEYDIIVENNESLYVLPTNTLIAASLSCTVVNGKITQVSIDNAGRGYSVAPTVSILFDTSDVIITTIIDVNGSVISAVIVNGGSNFVIAPELTVRPYTAIVSVDIDSNNTWAKYEWQIDEWVKIHTQEYNTPSYWNYIDWKSASFNASNPLSATIDQLYLLETLTLKIGDYVKVKNQGNGKFIILEKVIANGTFDNTFNLVYSEKGTIQFSELLWNTVNSRYNWDYLNTYDQTLYDQSPDVEISKILLAIKEDIFIGPLKIYWNKFFFKAVKFAMSEQIFLDWAFKTSFINVRNLAGTLDQRSTYKFQNSEYYESYINEVKPYHTKIRTFQIEYDVSDSSQTYTSDFDLPAEYDSTTNTFIPIELGDSILDVYPRKAWKDNYKYSVDSIVVYNGVAGYTSVPSVIITPAVGDTGSGATAIAHIALGKVSEIVVTNPGSNYTLTPTVKLIGGITPLFEATAYATLINNRVRSSSIEMKFDRTSTVREIGNARATDSFVGNGVIFKFTLGWVAEHAKSNINITLNGIIVIAADYELVDYIAVYNGYHKKYTNIILATSPANGSVLSIEYNKNISIYNAIERIEDYYTPTSGMPGLEADQLMTGAIFPGTIIQTLPLLHNANWDNSPYGQELWGPDIYGVTGIVVVDGGSGYTTPPTVHIIEDDALIVNPASAVAYINSGTITSIKIINPGAGYSSSTRVILQSHNIGVVTATVQLLVAERDIDTIITGGGITSPLLNEDDIILDGSEFISPNVGYAPEEVVPGKILESVGISVFTMDPNSTSTIFGYKIFKDIFGRDHYKRLSKNNATQLTMPLYNTSLKISVANASVLPDPVTATNYAGVISIAGERIEYTSKIGNTLSGLRRGTLGTGPKLLCPVGTEVMDQGRDQTIPDAQEVYEILNTSTIHAQLAYSLSGIINLISGDKSTTDELLIPITLSTNAWDQVDVYYGGTLLNKTDMYYQDTTIAYDSTTATIVGIVSTATSLPVTSVLGTAYLVTSTNCVWIYERSINASSINGYVFNGLKRKEREFAINTVTNQLILNLPFEIVDGISLKIVNKRTSTDGRWQYAGASLVNSTSSQAVFLSNGLAALPDKYHYGQA